jgi:hypothetical protein
VPWRSIDRPPTRFDLPGREEPVYIATQRWALEPWEGEDPPGLAEIWSGKPTVAVNGSRPYAELAIVDHMRADGWQGVWVNAFRSELRSEWCPAPAVKTLARPSLWGSGTRPLALTWASMRPVRTR